MSLEFTATALSGNVIPMKQKKIDVPASKNKFTPAVLEALADDLQKGRIPLDRVTVSDSLQSGLRAIVRNTGLISYHVSYDVTDSKGNVSRPYLRLGSHDPGNPDHLTVADARHLAKTVRGLADMGIDVQAGLHARLMLGSCASFANAA